MCTTSFHPPVQRRNKRPILARVQPPEINNCLPYLLNIFIQNMYKYYTKHLHDRKRRNGQMTKYQSSNISSKWSIFSGCARANIGRLFLRCTRAPPVKNRAQQGYMHPMQFLCTITTLYGLRSQELQPRSACASDLCTFKVVYLQPFLFLLNTLPYFLIRLRKSFTRLIL